MAKIRDILKFRRKKEKKPINLEEHKGRAKERQQKPPPNKPAEILTIDQLRRMMGDTGPRRFLKDRGNRRK